MKLEDIGFYTLSDERAKTSSATSPMQRCELIITDKCNFKCKYCRGIRDEVAGTLSTERCKEIVSMWADDGLVNIRFSGGEPTTHEGLLEIIQHSKACGIKRIAISTNGSASTELYDALIDAGVNDFSISLDACCAAFGDSMAGVKGCFDTVIKNIKHCASRTYVTVGIVLTEENVSEATKIVEFAHSLGVADIRVISAAQYANALKGCEGISDEILNAHPILKYRINNLRNGVPVRGLFFDDSENCYLSYDDSVIVGNKVYPCIIHFREGGEAICDVGPDMRAKRVEWLENHDSYRDEICRNNCLDVCREYNNTWDDLNFGYELSE